MGGYRGQFIMDYVKFSTNHQQMQFQSHIEPKKNCKSVNTQIHTKIAKIFFFFTEGQIA